ncbi:Signal transduction histidine kinase [Lachnospiraceae bacterium XBB2008]|nr:Signal transduction histidine kinase [Lachnospiraceae bacterium XBB2008]
MSKGNRNSIKESRIPITAIIKHYGPRRALIFVLLALSFAALILVYNMLLRNFVTRSLQTESEISAINSAKEVDIYLSTGTDVIDVAEYTVEKMLSENRTDEEILEYLTYETNTIQNSILPATTGIYGCIRDRYFDGSGWDPGEDYVPQERPWYLEAVADKGNIVLINPYFDLYSEEVVMTIAKALPDGENVVAVDITLGRIQEITEENVGNDADTKRMVISSNGFVVAHSDIDERAANYLEETGTFGNLVLTSVLNSENDFTDIRYQGDYYTVYGVPIGKDWYSISVVDSRKLTFPLLILAVTSGFAIIATFVIFTVIMLRTGKRTIIADNLQSILSSSADIYMSLCDLDVINNSVTGIKNVNPAIAKAVESCDGNMKEIFAGIMTGLPESPTKQAAVEFSDLSTIDERMKDTDIATVEYLSYGNIWVRARLLVSERTPEGKVSHVLWMLENIDQEKKERDSLIDLSERAFAASEAKSAFLSNMSHEIRTPINAILGMNEVVLRECRDENIISYSENIRSSGQTLLGLVNDILDFSKIESGKLEIIPADYELASMLNDLVNMVRPRMDKKGLDLILNIDKNIPEKLFGDDVRIRQVITNILTNAVKYTEHGSVTFSMSHDRLEYSENEIMLHVKIKDTGIGIKKEDMNRLFSEFERIEEKRNRNIEGTGLGMAITQSLLELMNSRLNVSSRYGEGSEFSFDLIQRVRDWEPIGDYETAYRKTLAHKEGYHRQFTAPDARILVVDDTPMNLLVFTSLLEPTELKIDTAGSGDEGIELALKNRYDMIFLDHMMPDKDGIETLKEIRGSGEKINDGTPFICLTANAISGAREQYLEAGFDDYLTKPIDSKKLEKMILSYLPSAKVNMAHDDREESPDASAGSARSVGAPADGTVLPEALYAMIDLNPVEGVKRCGSPKIYLNALRAFSDSIRPTIAATRNYKNSDDMDDVMITVHSIKTAAGMVGAERISNMALGIEKAGPENFSEERLNELFDRCIELCNNLTSLI